MPHPHTAEDISETLYETLKDWGIENKICSLTTDNVENCIAASKCALFERNFMGKFFK